MITAGKIIAGLNGNPHTGMCPCPAHDDDTPSLHVTEKGGKVVFYCHAGCSQNDVIAALRPLGGKSEPGFWGQPERDAEAAAATAEEHERWMQSWAILRSAAGAWAFPRKNRDKLSREPGRELIGRYLSGRGINTIPASAMLMIPSESKRLLGRRFPAMIFMVKGRPDGRFGALVTHLSTDGSTKLNIDTPRKMYGLIKGGYIQLNEIDPDQPLLIAEGVETALSAAQIAGFPAIAAGSATNLPHIIPPPCAEVIICPDNDEPGLRAAHELADQLASTGRIVRLATIPPRHPRDNGSWNDWNDVLRRGGNLEQYREWICEAQQVKGSKTARALSMSEFLGLELPPVSFLLRPWLATGNLIMIHAQRGIGKTRLVMAIGYAIATGQMLLDWQTQRAAKVLYIDGELTAQSLQQRIRVLGDPTPNLAILSRDVLMRTQQLPLPDLAEEEGRDFLDRVIQSEQAEVIILDSLSTLIRSGVENEAESWTPIQDWLLAQRFRGRTVILIHHEGRSGKPRGTSKREDPLDAIIRLEEVSDAVAAENEAWMRLSFTKKREFAGDATAPRVVRCSTASGFAQWTIEGDPGDPKHERIIALHKQGMTQKEIATEVGLTQARVSQILAEVSDDINREPT